jgi:subtilisin family serine protease
MSVDRAYAEVVKNRKGSPVVVAIIDSGIDLGHEELQDLLWKNPKEIAGDGLDNDQNGYIDDVQQMCCLVWICVMCVRHVRV